MKRIILYGLGKKGMEYAEDIIRHAEILQVSVVALMDREKTELKCNCPVYQPGMSDCMEGIWKSD